MKKLESIRIQGALGVILCGFIGGLLIWLIGIRNGEESKVHQLADPFISSILGGAASLIFIYLISNTDRSDNTRLMTLALLSGLCWEPVLEAGTVFIDHNNQKIRAKEATQIVEKVAFQLNSLPDLDTKKEERKTAINKLNSNLKDIEPIISKIDNISIRKKAINSKYILEEALEKLPENEEYLLLSTLEQSLNPNSLIPSSNLALAYQNQLLDLPLYTRASIKLNKLKPDQLKPDQLNPDQLNRIFDFFPKVENTIEPVASDTATSIKGWRAICFGEEGKGFCPKSASHEFWSYVGENSDLKIKESRGWLLYKHLVD